MAVTDFFFESTPFKRWVLVPVLVAFAAFLILTCIPQGADEWNATHVGVSAVLAALSLLYAAALLWPRRVPWAGRAAAAIVFLTYVAYLVDELRRGEETFRLDDRRSAATPGNALKGLIVIGLPALYFALRRRRPDPE